MSIALSGFGRTFRLSDETRDHVLVTLWILITFTQFKYDELLLYPLALYFFWAFIRDFELLFDMIVRSLIVWSYPVWFFLSMSWGAETGLIFRTGLQLILTIMICYCAALRLSGRQIMLSVMIAAGWYGVLSALETDGEKYARGVFKSKNAFGSAMVMLFIASLCVFIDKTRLRLIRLAAGALLILSILMIQRSASATATLLAAGSFICVITILGRQRLSTSALVGTCLILVGLICSLGAVFSFLVTTADPVTFVLEAFGKDATLTGRTVLWGYAAEEISRHPLLGVGYGGFWTPFDPFSVAREIYDEFYKSYHAAFSFHSTFYEIAVHQGLIGVALVGMTTFWLVLNLLPGAFIGRQIGSIYLLCTAAVTLALSLTEVVLMVPFKLDFMIFLIGGLLAIKREVPMRKMVLTPMRVAAE